MTTDSRELIRAAVRDDLFLFAKHTLNYTDLVPRCHQDMVRALMAPTTRKLIVMPRGTFKTSITSVAYPIWLLLQDPNHRILLDSELYTNSKNILREIKNHLSSPGFIDLFGDWRTRTWNEGEIIIRPRTQNLKEASVTCSGIGAQKTGQHYSVVIADDLNSPSNSATPEGKQKVIQHYRYYTSLLDPGGTLVIVGTRYAAEDVIGFCLENEIGHNLS